MEIREEKYEDDEFYDVAAIKSVISIPQEFEDMLYKMKKGALQMNVKSVCVLGATGSGKSSTCKTITGSKTNEIFNPSSSLSAATYETKGSCTNWFGKSDLEPVIVLDTPGLGDTEGRDTQHIA